MSDHDTLPLRRVALWGLLVAVLLAVTVAAIFAPQWAAEGRGVALPRIARLPPTDLVDHEGREVALASLAGRPWIADLIFTRCGGTCPRLTQRMRTLGAELAELKLRGPVRRVSVSVDPEYDRPEVLMAYRRSFGISDTQWLFLTGERSDIDALIRHGFKLGLDRSPPHPNPDEPIMHSTRFLLIDANLNLRGAYDAFDAAAMERLLKDAETLVRDEG